MKEIVKERKLSLYRTGKIGYNKLNYFAEERAVTHEY